MGKLFCFWVKSRNWTVCSLHDLLLKGLNFQYALLKTIRKIVPGLLAWHQFWVSEKSQMTEKFRLTRLQVGHGLQQRYTMLFLLPRLKWFIFTFLPFCLYLVRARWNCVWKQKWIVWEKYILFSWGSGWVGLWYIELKFPPVGSYSWKYRSALSAAFQKRHFSDAPSLSCTCLELRPFNWEPEEEQMYASTRCWHWYVNCSPGSLRDGKKLAALWHQPEKFGWLSLQRLENTLYDNDVLPSSCFPAEGPDSHCWDLRPHLVDINTCFGGLKWSSIRRCIHGLDLKLAIWSDFSTYTFCK